MQRQTHTIDATDKILGRLATQIAVLLMGKNKLDFASNKDMGDFVVIKNADRIRVSGRKKSQKKYYHHSGFMGGLKEVPFEKIFKREPGDILRRAVYGMLPKNRLRAKMIKRLKIIK